MNKLFLNMVMLPSALWRSMGADIVQLRAILNVRLLLDDRKPMSMMMRQQKQKKDRKYGTLINTIVFLIMGLMYIFPLAVVSDRIVSLTVYFSFLLGLMTLMLITDFSNVLFDSRDKYIIFPRPVDDRTVVLSRLLHVFIYLFRIVLPMSLPGWVFLGYVNGWKSALLFPFVLILLVCVALFAVNAVYILVLRLAKPEKFKDIMNYFQIAVSIVFFASFYTIPRLFDPEHPLTINVLDHPWLRFVPSYWLASCWSWIGFPVVLAGTGMSSAIGVLFPMVCVFILVKYLSPQFTKRIAGIDTVDIGEHKPTPATKGARASRFYQKMAYLFNSSDDARAGFMITWLQTSRSRSFRMRVLPSFAFVPIYFFYTLTQNHRSFSDAYRNLPEHSMYLLLLYMSSYVMISAMNYLTISDQYKAAWVYYATPVATPGKIMMGAFKAIWIKYFLPFFIVISAFVLYTWGSRVIVDILLAMINVTLFVVCISRITHRHLPFSLMEQMNQKGGRFLKSLIVMFIPAVLGFGHYFALHLWWLKMIFLVLSAILLWLVWDSYGNTTWDSMVKTDNE